MQPSSYANKNRTEYVKLLRRALDDAFASQGVSRFQEGHDIDLSSTFSLFKHWEKTAGVEMPTTFYADVVAEATNAFLDTHDLVLQEYYLNIDTFSVRIRARFHVSEK